MSQSIKERIISVTRGDPFLTVEQIAKKSKTTPQYVRTTLSEARLSLANLRRDYARQMERKLGQEELGLEFNDVPLSMDIRFTKTKDPLASKKLNLQDDHVLTVATRLIEIEQIVAVAQLLTVEPLTIVGEGGSLRQLLPKTLGPIKAQEQWVEVHIAPRNLHEVLKLQEDDRIFRICTVWEGEKGPVGVEYQLMPVDGISLRWSGLPETLRITMNG